MVAKDQESNNDHLQDFDHEAEETLSLCDLVQSNTNWNNNNDFYQSASDDQDLFEFFTEDYTASSTSAYPKDGIIFCGKLIPCKPEQIQKQNMSRSTSTKAQQQNKSSYKYKALSQRKGHHQKNSYDHYDFSIKPRWYLLAFGYGRFPSEMKLRDIKNRQSRGIPPPRMFPSDGGGCGGMVKKSEKRSSPWKGLWTLLEVLGCKSQQASAVVKASFECIRHV